MATAKKTGKKAARRKGRAPGGHSPRIARKAVQARRRPRTGAPVRAGDDRSAAGPLPRSGLTAADIMEQNVLTVKPGTPVDEVSALFKLHNIKGAPVVDGHERLVGIVTEDDLVFGQLGVCDEERELLASSGSRGGARITRRVAEIMTQNPIAAAEETPIEDLCRLMVKLKIHRIPIVSRDRVVGIVSTIDVCRILAEGRVRLVRG